jgi:hypothetical protein
MIWQHLRTEGAQSEAAALVLETNAEATDMANTASHSE